MPGPEKPDRWPWLQQTLRTTRWSLVPRVRKSDSIGPAPGAEEFCRCYWYPLYAFLRRRGYAEGEAQDHVQSFLLLAIEDNLLASADPGKGRLRNFLMTLLIRHISSRTRRDRAQKRGGRARMLPWEWATAEAAFQRQSSKAPSPEDAYRRALAEQLVAEGVAALRRHYENSGRQALCEELLPALEGPLPNGAYDAVAARLGMRPEAVRRAASRMRERFRLAVTEAAAAALGMRTGPQLDAELREIFCSPSRPTSL